MKIGQGRGEIRFADEMDGKAKPVSRILRPRNCVFTVGEDGRSTFDVGTLENQLQHKTSIADGPFRGFSILFTTLVPIGQMALKSPNGGPKSAPKTVRVY